MTDGSKLRSSGRGTKATTRPISQQRGVGGRVHRCGAALHVELAAESHLFQSSLSNTNSIWQHLPLYMSKGKIEPVAFTDG